MIRSDEGLTLETSASESLYGGQFTLSTQLLKPNYLVILPRTQHHSFFRNLPPLFLKFWLTLANHKENNCHKLSQVAYNGIKRFKDKIFWSQKIKNFLYHIGLGNLWGKTHFSDVEIISIIKQRLESIELQRWSNEMNNGFRKDPNQSSKMRIYRKVKKVDNYRCEDYLHQVTNIRHRTTMTKLRLSSHRLAIETGCYMRPYKKPNERICPLCKKEAEYEKHFLISC